MRKSRDRPLEFRGQVTVFLSLILVLLVSFVGSMIESASISLTKSRNQSDLTLAMESIFAEYEPRLLEDYGIFARQGSDRSTIERRLSYYGAENLKHNILRMELLSDGSGKEVYRQGVAAMGGKVEEIRPLLTYEYEEEAKNAFAEYETLLEEEQMEDPLELKEVGESFLLSRVLPAETMLSNKQINLQLLPSHRQLRTGIGVQSQVSDTLADKWLFATYLTNHFLTYVEGQNTNPLSYEIEYLLAGKASDSENLTWVAKRLLVIRLGMNYTLLQVDEERLSKAESISIAVSALMLTPEAKEIIKQALLFYWAYEDSVEDLQKLYRGETVPLLNSEEGGGISYEGYLRALLAAEQTETLCMRALDLLELNLGVQVDTLVTELELESKGVTRRNITYTCHAEYCYP